MGGQEESWRVGDEKRAGGLEGGRQGRMAASQRMKAGQVHFNSSLLAACKVCLRNERLLSQYVLFAVSWLGNFLNRGARD